MKQCVTGVSETADNPKQDLSVYIVPKEETEPTAKKK